VEAHSAMLRAAYEAREEGQVVVRSDNQRRRHHPERRRVGSSILLQLTAAL